MQLKLREANAKKNQFSQNRVDLSWTTTFLQQAARANVNLRISMFFNRLLLVWWTQLYDWKVSVTWLELVWKLVNTQATAHNKII